MAATVAVATAAEPSRSVGVLMAAGAGAAVEVLYVEATVVVTALAVAAAVVAVEVAVAAAVVVVEATAAEMGAEAVGELVFSPRPWIGVVRVRVDRRLLTRPAGFLPLMGLRLASNDHARVAGIYVLRCVR